MTVKGVSSAETKNRNKAHMIECSGERRDGFGDALRGLKVKGLDGEGIVGRLNFILTAAGSLWRV